MCSKLLGNFEGSMVVTTVFLVILVKNNTKLEQKKSNKVVQSYERV
jgi:hypothetical protein